MTAKTAPSWGNRKHSCPLENGKYWNCVRESTRPLCCWSVTLFQ